MFLMILLGGIDRLFGMNEGLFSSNRQYGWFEGLVVWGLGQKEDKGLGV
jgi:hypothetical protein